MRVHAGVEIHRYWAREHGLRPTRPDANVAAGVVKLQHAAPLMACTSTRTSEQAVRTGPFPSAVNCRRCFRAILPSSCALIAYENVYFYSLSRSPHTPEPLHHPAGPRRASTGPPVRPGIQQRDHIDVVDAIGLGGGVGVVDRLREVDAYNGGIMPTGVQTMLEEITTAGKHNVGH